MFSETIIHCSCICQLSACIITYFGLNDMYKQHTVISDALFPEILHFLASHYPQYSQNVCFLEKDVVKST